ncbi:hypothetical protein NP233_g828 [Leucocoprinus birnbaumii]|uniref:Nephrocystin 3-like N-terminal domain-containing protein n=1 Tax=Leucocoprinus birnbaumii TaxID=56174 RepID=A0AAD5W1I1_9AGAR|nr:hypothetical protein NP233_g828 [Leucocoprinus birnbaumii]
MFSSAHDFVIKQLHVNVFNKNSTEYVKGAGLRDLLGQSMRNAFLDSSTRWPPPKCHDNTRKELLDTIYDWESRNSDRVESIFWLDGPFGIGKSALAQTFAERLLSKSKLRASLFFSRSNGLSDPSRIIPSIVYQLAVKFSAFGELLDHIIQGEPSLITSSFPDQFQRLLVGPLHQIGLKGVPMEGWIVLDGLDEIDGIEPQKEIIRLIATSVQDKTTPFLWFITSPIPEGDPDILLYLTTELEKICKAHHLSRPWPLEVHIEALAEFTEGLWVCAAALVQFIGDRNSLGPEAQLSLVLSLPKSDLQGQNHPLAAMDVLYTMIMQQVPSRIISTLRKLLLLNRVYSSPSVNKVLEIANVLNLSEKELRFACSSLHSVLFLDSVKSVPSEIRFYHTSFMDFMEDFERSGKFCLYGECLEELQQEVIGRLNELTHPISGDISDALEVTFPSSSGSAAYDLALLYHSLSDALLKLCDSDCCAITPSVATSLLEFQFTKLPLISHRLHSHFRTASLRLDKFQDNLPPGFRDKILHTVWNPIAYFPKPSWASVGRLPLGLGGRSRLVVWFLSKQSLAVAESGFYSSVFGEICQAVPRPLIPLFLPPAHYLAGCLSFYLSVADLFVRQAFQLFRVRRRLGCDRSLLVVFVPALSVRVFLWLVSDHFTPQWL